MVKAGANINGNGDTRPLRDALRFDKAELVEKLVADGADVTYRPSSDAARNANSQAACQPRADHSLYQSMLGYARPRNEEAALRIIRALASKGLSPMAKWGYGEQGQCKYASLYDLVIDTGNLAYANRIKEVALKPPAAPKPQSTAETSATPLSTPSAETKTPEKIGAWQIKTDNGRLVAIARAKNLNNKTKDINNGFAALRLECVAGKLEYVPIALKLGVMTSLWIESADDITNEFRLVNQRLAGATATALANDVAVTEAIYRRNGTAEWGTGMNVESSSAPMDQVMMTGFSEMRAFMRANCKR